MPRVRTARIVRPTLAQLRRLARHLAKGGLVAVPTETVYGLAADALNPRACAAIFKAKGRPRTDPLIVHIARPDDLGSLALVNPLAEKLAAAFWPGPLTIVLPKRPHVPDIVTAGGATVAVRCPAHPVMRRLLRLCGRPLAAPSANPFGYISPTSAAHVMDGLGEKIPYVLDGGSCRVGVESTIVDLTDPAAPRVLRTGGITAAQLRRVLRRPVSVVERRASAGKRQLAPGMLTQHYSPHTPLKLRARITANELRRGAPGTAYLLFRQPRDAVRKDVRAYVLSRDGGVDEAARRLYAGLHELDHAGFSEIHAELAPERGAGVAINDRLRRAAARRPEL